MHNTLTTLDFPHNEIPRNTEIPDKEAFSQSFIDARMCMEGLVDFVRESGDLPEVQDRRVDELTADYDAFASLFNQKFRSPTETMSISSPAIGAERIITMLQTYYSELLEKSKADLATFRQDALTSDEAILKSAECLKDIKDSEKKLKIHTQALNYIPVIRQQSIGKN